MPTSNASDTPSVQTPFDNENDSTSRRSKASMRSKYFHRNDGPLFIEVIPKPPVSRDAGARRKRFRHTPAPGLVAKRFRRTPRRHEKVWLFKP